MSMTVEDFRRVLDYDAETGAFSWRVTNSNRAVRGSNAGTPHCRGYVVVTVFGRKFLAHRLVWFYVHGEWPPHEIDHINLDPSDNRLSNLRLATRAQNERNKRSRRDNASGAKGVQWHAEGRKWMARIRTNGKTKYLGLFEDKAEAAAAYERAAVEHYGEYARAS